MPLRNWAFCLVYKTAEKILDTPASVIPHAFHLFSVCTGNTCGAASPLPEDYCDNFDGNPITGDRPHDPFMRQVLYRNGASCRTVLNRTARWSPDVMNLKLHHEQMHYRKSSFFQEFRGKTTTKGIKNILPGQHKLQICWKKSNLGGVNLVGLYL